jgi:hypothetical protein
MWASACHPQSLAVGDKSVGSIVSGRRGCGEGSELLPSNPWILSCIKLIEAHELIVCLGCDDSIFETGRMVNVILLNDSSPFAKRLLDLLGFPLSTIDTPPVAAAAHPPPTALYSLKSQQSNKLSDPIPKSVEADEEHKESETEEEKLKKSRIEKAFVFIPSTCIIASLAINDLINDGYSHDKVGVCSSRYEQIVRLIAFLSLSFVALAFMKWRVKADAPHITICSFGQHLVSSNLVSKYNR